jgi:hypothetical protein
MEMMNIAVVFPGIVPWRCDDDEERFWMKLQGQQKVKRAEGSGGNSVGQGEFLDLGVWSNLGRMKC